MENERIVDCGQGAEELAKVEAHIDGTHISKIFLHHQHSLRQPIDTHSEILMPVIWQNGNDLIVTSESRDQRAHGLAIPQVMK